jgi:hypothetical protein
MYRKNRSLRRKKKISGGAVANDERAYLDLPVYSPDGISGGGISEIWSYITDRVNMIKKLFGPQINDYPARVKKYLDATETETIKSIKIARAPVRGALAHIINLITGGDLKRNQARLQYDEIFHLSMVIVLSNNQSIIVEKNQVIAIWRIDAGSYRHVVGDKLIDQPPGDAPESMDVIWDMNTSLKDLLNNARVINPQRFFQYDAASTNCQEFVIQVLKANNLITPELKKYVLQDAMKLLTRNTSFLRLVTNLGAKISHFVD